MSLRFAVIHLGARLHYAAPVALDKAGMLQVLYTDATAHTPGAGLLRPLSSLRAWGGVRRLFARNISPTIARNKIRSWLWPTVQIELFNRRRPVVRKCARTQWGRALGGHWLAQRAITDDFGGANALYVHPCVSTEAMREAKRRGMFVVLEAISHPFNKLVEKAEYERFGCSAPETEGDLRNDIDFLEQEAGLADLILAASPYVRQGLVELGIDARRIALVPYGLDSADLDAMPKPVEGRVLFVGNVGYLKGLPYLAEAARTLRKNGFRGEIRAVGPHDRRIIHRAEFIGPDYVGQVPRSEIKHEFLQADVFAFPTVSDGFGLVLLEAMAVGLPIVCTPNCADVVREGETGFVVPPRDSEALASSINRIVSDRVLRTVLSDNARRAFSKFSLEAYAQRLAGAINASQASLRKIGS